MERLFQNFQIDEKKNTSSYLSRIFESDKLYAIMMEQVAEFVLYKDHIITHLCPLIKMHL